MTTDIEILIQNLQSDDSEIRLLALDTLTRYEFRDNDYSTSIPRIQEILIRYTRIEDEEFQHLIRAAIANIEMHISKNSLVHSDNIKETRVIFNLKDLKDSNRTIRKQCLIQVINHKRTEAYDSILDMLIYEKDPQVLILAIKALANIAKPNITLLLQIFNYFPEIDVRKTAMLAIDELASYPEIVDLILPALDLSRSEDVRIVMDILSKYKPKDIFSYIKNKLQDKREHRRLLALKSLSKLEGDEVIELINISANDRSSQIRVLSVKVLSGRSQTSLIMPILNRLAHDQDIEVSEVALKSLNSYTEQTPVQYIKLVEPSTSLSESTIEKIEKPIPFDPSLEKPQNIVFKDASSVDLQIELGFMELGKQFHRKINSGDIEREEFLKHINIVTQASKKLKELEQTNHKDNLVKSIKKALSGNLNDKLALQNAKIALEEAYVDLGETGYNIVCSENISIEGTESYINNLTELFKIRKELSPASS